MKITISTGLTDFRLDSGCVIESKGDLGKAVDKMMEYEGDVIAG